MLKTNKIFLKDCELVYHYLLLRNSFKLDWVNYKIFKKRIFYILNKNNWRYIRFLFHYLHDLKVFEKKYINQNIHYRFNPFGNPDPPKLYLLDWT